MSAGRDRSPDTRELATVLRDLAWTIQRLVPETTGLDPLPITELVVLKRVQAAPGTTVTELARQLGMQQSNTSTAVRGLVERGLVARESSPADRRVSLLVPTEKSLAANELVDRVWSGTIRTAMTALPPAEVAALEAAAGALLALDQVLRAEWPASRSHR